jgi:Tfp pilus assembly protein PilN
MIKINLLPQKRPKRVAGRAASDPAARHVLYGVLALAGAGALLVMLVDRPMRARVQKYREDEAALQREISKKNALLVGYPEMEKARVEAEARKESIDRLMRAKVVPAHVLHELSEILTASRMPTMTSDMVRRTSNQKSGDPNKRIQQDWDPQHVWLSGLSDVAGQFKLEGGAQSESDVTQLSKRLAASVYFMDVTPVGGERVTDTASGVSYYKFVITGRVAY